MCVVDDHSRTQGTRGFINSHVTSNSYNPRALGEYILIIFISSLNCGPLTLNTSSLSARRAPPLEQCVMPPVCIHLHELVQSSFISLNHRIYFCYNTLVKHHPYLWDLIFRFHFCFLIIPLNIILKLLNITVRKKEAFLDRKQKSEQKLMILYSYT